MNEKLILTDCDGVLLNWEYAFGVWVLKHGHKEVEDGHLKYGIQKRFDIDKEQARTLVKTFNESASIGFLPALRDAIAGVTRLREEGYSFHVITSLSTDPDAQTLRQMNLDKLFGEGTFEKIIYLETGGDKDYALDEYAGTGLWWIEDKIINAELGHHLGLKSIIMEHGHNMDYEGECLLLKNWEEICATILGDANA